MRPALPAFAVLVAFHSVGAQDTAFVRALRAQSTPFTLAAGRLAGPGADILAREARNNQFLLVGEDHGFKEIPQFISALFDAAYPAGFRHLAVEVGPITARQLETEMRAPDAQSQLSAFLTRYTPYTIPFFFWREEAEMLEQVVKRAGGATGTVWGLDQEFIMSPTYLLERLAQIAPNATARSLATRFANTSAKGDKAMVASGNPGAVWMVTSTDADVGQLQSAFGAGASPEAREIVSELAISRDIYRRFNTGDNHESNQIRDDLMKRHFLAAYRAAQASGEASPKVIVKLGANHIFRGPSITGSYELGSFIPEFAVTTGGKSFGILAVVKRGTVNAFRPFGSTEADKTAAYDLLTSAEYAVFDMKSVLAASSDSAWTLIDLRPVRALALDGNLKRLDPTARRLLLSFDAVVVVPESHASVYFH